MNGAVAMKRERITLERTFDAALEDVWELWTTVQGLESWWGPDGFKVKVRSLDLRPGGELRYAMIATAPEQVAFMKRAGMPTTTESRIVYTDVTPLKRLAYRHDVDFFPGVAAYDVETVIELCLEKNRVQMTLLLDPMHDADWNSRMVAGWEQELGHLDAVLRERRGR